jgi:hypothetical protein
MVCLSNLKAIRWRVPLFWYKTLLTVGRGDIYVLRFQACDEDNSYLIKNRKVGICGQLLRNYVHYPLLANPTLLGFPHFGVFYLLFLP